jgi:hypothetical protein
MEDYHQYFAVLRNDAAAQEWKGTCARLMAMFEKLDADAKAALVTGDECVPALLHAIGLDSKGSSGGYVEANAACEALNALISGLPVGAKQPLLNGEKGVVRGLLRVLGDANGKVAWGSACLCFSNMFIGIPADRKEALLSDDRGIVEAIIGVFYGNELTAWVGASAALNNFLMLLSVGAKQSLLSGEKGVMLSTTIIARLESEDAHSSWMGSMSLLKRVVYQQSSLSHINLCTLGFLKKDRGLMAALLRFSRGISTDTDNRVFNSVCETIRSLSMYGSNPPFIHISLEVLTLLVAAIQLCSYDPALKVFGNAMSNFSEQVSHSSVLAQAKLHEYALSKMTGISAADDVWSQPASLPTRSLSIIVNMSRNDALHEELKRCHVIDILTPIAVPSCAAQLRVLMAMSYIIGCKESTGPSGSGTSLALTHLANSTSIGKIIDCLENTLNLKGGPGYGFGSLVLPSILQVRRRFVSWFDFFATVRFLNSVTGDCRAKLQ